MKINFFEEKEEKIVLLMSIMFIFLTTLLAILLYKNFHTIYEISLLEQPIWNTIHGNFFYSVSGLGNLFANHNHPILFLLLPVYFLFQYTLTIIIIENIFIALGAFIIYKFAKEELNNKLLGIIFTGSYLLFPSFYYSNIRSFHPIMLIIPLFLLMFYFLFKKKWNLFFIFFALSLLVKEDIAITLFLLGIYIFFKYSKQKGLIVGSISLIWFLLSTQIIIPSFGGSSEFVGLYSHIGETPSEIIVNTLKDPIGVFSYGFIKQKITYLTVLFRHTMFTSLFNPSFILLTIPILLQNILNISPYKYNYFAHYTYPLIPIIFMASIFGTKRIIQTNFIKIKKIVRLNLIITLLIIMSLSSFLVYGLHPILEENCYLFNNLYKQGKCPETNDIIGNSPKENYENITMLIKMIPKNASVMSQNHLSSRFSTREKSYLFSRFSYDNHAEYFLFDTKGDYSPVNDLKEYWSEFIEENYELVEKKGDAYLFKKKIK